MAPKKKQNQGDFKQEDVLQAVVIADSFNSRFAPVTSKTPRCLLPLANIPIIDYTLAFLSSAGIQETFVFISNHVEQIKAHIASKWSSCEMDVQVLVAEDCLSAGDALRDVDAKSLIHSDFVLVHGDLVSNVKLAPLIQAHKERRLKDKTPVMTMLFKKAPPGHRSRCKEEETAVLMKTSNCQLLFHKRGGHQNNLNIPVDLISDHNDLELHYDLLDCNISICSPHVLPLFTDEFDFLTREHFIKGILDNEEIFGHTIHVQLIDEEYAARVANLHMYDAISQDVLSRWVFPFSPDSRILVSDPQCSHGHHNVYMESDVTLARGCVLEENIVIGQSTMVGKGAHLSHSVIGKNCSIGRNVRLLNAYIFDNVTIGDDCVVTTSLLGQGVYLEKGVKVHPGCVLGPKVAVSSDITLSPGTRLTAEAPTDDFDDTPAKPLYECDHGSAYIHEDNAEDDDEVDELSADIWGLQLESEDEQTDDWLASDVEGEEDEMDDDFANDDLAGTETDMFLEEVVGTLERGIAENISTENVVLEVNSLKHAYGIQIKEVNMNVTRALIELPLKDAKDLAPPQYLAAFKTNMKRFLPLLKNYMKNEESQSNCLHSIEEICSRIPLISPKIFVKIIHFFYDNDVLSEDVIFKWFHAKPEAPHQEKCRKEASAFVEWLQEAEEESEDE